MDSEKTSVHMKEYIFSLLFSIKNNNLPMLQKKEIKYKKWRIWIYKYIYLKKQKFQTQLINYKYI